MAKKDSVKKAAGKGGREVGKRDTKRRKVLVPSAAHGTNPASAVMAGFKVVPVACLKDGDIDLADLDCAA